MTRFNESMVEPFAWILYIDVESIENGLYLIFIDQNDQRNRA